MSTGTYPDIMADLEGVVVLLRLLTHFFLVLVLIVPRRVSLLL